MWISFFIAISLFIKTWFIQIPIDTEPKTNADIQTEEIKQAQKEQQALIDAQPRVYEKILWESDDYMMIEYCKTGFYAPMLKYPEYIRCDDDFGFEGLSFKFTTKDGTALPISETLSTEFVVNQHNPGGSVFKDTFTPDGKYWLYIDYWTQNEHQLMAHNIQTGEDVALMSFLEFEYTACNDVTFFGWNPGETKLGIIASNQESSQYPTKTKLFILTIENGLLIQKNKYNISVNTDCSANNGAIYAIDWLDDNTVQYYDPKNNPFNDYNAADYDPEFFDTLYLEQFDTENPIEWNTEWVQTEDVE